jgi:ribonuclease HI
MTLKADLKPGKVKANYLGQQSEKETHLMWGDIPAVLEHDKYVHMIIDGGAKPNPASAGWGAIIRQNGKFAWSFDRCSRATNNAMELRAVIEALRHLPDDMHVWISTDSAYVKRGITDWLPGGTRNGWNNAQRNSVVNQTLWQALVAAVARMRVVQWTWVKAHNWYLLNECADMLATKGVANETPYSNVQYLHPINENIDFETYEFKEGEIPPLSGNWQGDILPETVFTMKRGEGTAVFLSSTTIPDTTPWPSTPASAQVSAVVNDVPSDEGPEI